LARPHSPARPAPFPTRRSSDLRVLMVRVTQVNAAALDGELLPQPVHRDGRALHMPARPPRAEWGIPLRLPGAVGPPQESRSGMRSEEHTSELQSRFDLVCRLLL